VQIKSTRSEAASDGRHSTAAVALLLCWAPQQKGPQPSKLVDFKPNRDPTVVGSERRHGRRYIFTPCHFRRQRFRRRATRRNGAASTPPTGKVIGVSTPRPALVRWRRCSNNRFCWGRAKDRLLATIRRQTLWHGKGIERSLSATQASQARFVVLRQRRQPGSSDLDARDGSRRWASRPRPPPLTLRANQRVIGG